MEDLTKIWNPIEVYTLTNRLLLIELEEFYNFCKTIQL